jgi:hypothetical protein
MLKSETALEVKKGERIYKLYCDNSSPLGELFDALSEMQQYVVGRIQETQPKKDESPAVEAAEILPSEE